MKRGRLKWVVRTAMPLKVDFEVIIDGEKVERTKEAFNPIVDFAIADMDSNRLTTLNEGVSDDRIWRVEDSLLVSKLFPNGVSGEIVVTNRSLVKGKSVDLGRSHGFFVYVRDRLVNQEDELFGLHALSHATFNFFRADVYAEDLHSDVTAPREGIEHGERRDAISDLLLALFNDARQRQITEQKRVDEGEKRKPEHERKFVSPRLVDQPIADVLAMGSSDEVGTDADDGWFFLRDIEQGTRNEVVEDLYRRRGRQYRFIYDRLGKTERVVKLNPQMAEFTLNEDHEVILAYSDDPRARQLLEDLVAAEVLLEVYLREVGVSPYVIGEVLERRDLLMRSLAQDRVFSLESIAQALLDARDDQYNLEIAVVAASRALGFNPDYSWNMLIRASNPAFSCGRSPVSLEPLSIRLNRLKNRTIEPVINRLTAKGAVTRRQVDFPVRNPHRFGPFHGPDASSVHYPGAQDTRASLCHNRFQSVAP